MSLTQLETVETELKHKRYDQNTVPKLTGLKIQPRGHQERLKRIKYGKDMAETRFRDFSVKKRGSRGLSARNQRPKRNYAYNRRSIAQKVRSRISGGISREIRGLDIKERTYMRGNLKVEGPT
jgi:hypothetical protein